jgi:hypothetical protein
MLLCCYWSVEYGVANTLLVQCSNSHSFHSLLSMITYLHLYGVRTLRLERLDSTHSTQIAD